MSDPPRWLDALLAGMPFGLLMAVTAWWDDGSWTRALFMATSGIPFGLGMAWWAARWRRDRQRLEADIPQELLPEARRVASGREVPDDPAVRSAAARLAAQGLADATKHRVLRAVAACVLLAGAVGAAINGSWWAILYGATGAAFLYLTWITPHRLRRHVDDLRADE